MSESTSETIDDGGPAFPTGIQPNDYMHPGMTFECGMTLRDWFAGQALAGLLATDSYGVLSEPQTAGMAYYIAGAMLDVREKQ